jgi:hypothetical protein
VQSDRNILPFGGWVQRIVGPVGGASGAVFMDAAIFRMEYSQPPLVFRFIGTVPQRGCQSPFSVVLVAVKNSQTVALFVGEDGIHAFDGTSTTPIGSNKVDQYVLGQFSRSYQGNICAMMDASRNLAFWLLPTQGGFSTKIIVFNWDLAAFSELEPDEMSGSPGTSPGTFGPLGLMTIGYTTDGLDVLATPTDQLTFPMDSRVWTGGAMAGPGYFDSENRLNYFIGPSMAAEIDTGQIDGGTGKRLFCGGVRPITDEPVAANISTQIVYSDQPNQIGTPTTPASSPAADGVCPHRISARYMSARVRLAAGASWTHLQGVEPRIRPEGRR